MKSVFITTLMVMTWTAHPQSHFTSVDSTGLPYQVIILTDSGNSYRLQSGDEIGLFADTLCVGADTYNGSGNFAVTAWEGSDQYNLPGFDDGDSIRIYIWSDIGSGFDEYELIPAYTTGNGTFGYGSFSACDISLAVPVLEVTETEHEFGTVLIGEESDGWTFTIKNSGVEPLTFRISIQNDSVFTLSYYTISSLEPQDSLQVGVHFLPKEEGVITDTVFITSSDPVNSTAEIILIGTGEDASSIVVGLDNIPLSFELKQNFPNPFNPSTTIPIKIPFSSNIKLTIYNVNGQEVAVLLDEFREAGNYLINWNAENFCSGTYFIKLDVNNQIMVQRGILLK